ncbi:MAG: metallophosphoesterase family protein [Deltaproteobacteria bacterium]|nr:metallophosphoesterase family protein [Kofleriaceae bacterium]
MKLNQKSFAALAVLALPACMMNQSGNIEATKTGDISRPAAKGSPVAELRAACGAEGFMTGPGVASVARQPYLQQVTPTSAMIGWVAVEGGEGRVEITTPDGAQVASKAADVEVTAVRVAGEQQVWAKVDGLAPDTIYCYALAGADGALSERIGFRTAPAADSERTIRVLAFGDSGGGGSDQQMLLDQMFEYPYDLMIHTGDLAYDDGTIGQFESTVFGVYADLFRHLPFFPASGNHDYRTLQGAPFRDVFALPGDNGERWYSYDWGRIHFVALDTEADYETQAAWLDEDLARTTLPWKVIYMHRPMYSSGQHGSDTSLRRALEPVIESHGVQLVLAGHDHNYERMQPQGGVDHVVTGGGGVGTRPVGSSSFTAFSEDVIHYVLLEVGTEEMIMHAIDGSGQEFDSTVIPRVR